MTDTTAPAAMPAMTTAAEPDGAPRVASLDILRGLAILAILFMNINDMGGSLWATFDNDIRRYGFTAFDQGAWVFREVFLNGTARCLLEMLFGVGMVILTDRAANAAAGKWAVLRQYWWRNFVLFLFGLVHVFILLWPGDILHTYGLAALLAVLFRRMKPKWLLTIGLVYALLQLVAGGVDYATRPAQRAEAARLETKVAAGQTLTADERKTHDAAQKRKAERDKNRAESKARADKEDHDRDPATATARSWAWQAWDTFLTIQSWGLEILFVWEALATMLIGAALYKMGIIQGQRSRAFYLRMTVIAYAIGLGSRSISAWQTLQFNQTPNIMNFMYETARLATTLGHVGLVYLLLATAAGTRLLKPFEAAGRTALTIYVLQTIACLWIIYPPFGLAQYGQHSWGVWMVTALVVNAVLLWWANWYVRDHKIAPVEWAWRSVVSGRMLSIRRGERGVAAGAVQPV